MTETKQQTEERILKQDKVAFYRLMSRGMKTNSETTVDHQKDLDYLIATILVDILDEIKEIKKELNKDKIAPITIKSK